jgi:hypothetical protein
MTMAQTVSGAFNTFRQNNVDLDPEQTRKARASRDYLFNQLTSLKRTDPGFPQILSTYRPYGSFARNSKVRPLDDIDFLMLLNSDGTSPMSSISERYTYRLQIRNRNSPLARFADESGYVNSIKVINKVKNSLALVPNYKQAELKRNNQAVTLSLQSYPWVFDIVAAALVDTGRGRTDHYLIPDGAGNWIATDPRIDAENITQTNNWHKGLFLPTLRLLKYWNRRTHKPRLSSYYFESLAIKVFSYSLPRISEFPSAISYFFSNCPNLLFSTFPDPKKLGSPLDSGLDWATKQKVSEAMKEAETHAGSALSYESRLQFREAIGYWKRVFDQEFPDYG